MSKKNLISSVSQYSPPEAKFLMSLSCDLKLICFKSQLTCMYVNVCPQHPMPATKKGKVREWICLVVLFPSRSKSIRVKTVRVFVDRGHAVGKWWWCCYNVAFWDCVLLALLCGDRIICVAVLEKKEEWSAQLQSLLYQSMEHIIIKLVTMLLHHCFLLF